MDRRQARAAARGKDKEMSADNLTLRQREKSCIFLQNHTGFITGFGAFKAPGSIIKNNPYGYIRDKPAAKPF